jgi:protein-disulfide isomerase
MSAMLQKLALLLAIAGLMASVTAAYVHYQMLADPSYASFCDVNATLSCTQVYASRYGSLWGVPVAVFGSIWFAFAALVAVAGVRGPASVRENVPGYLFAASTVGLAVVLYLGYASFFVLKIVCVLCVITYAAVIGLFLISGAATAIPMMSLPRRAAHDLKVLASSPLAIALAVLLVGGAVSTLAFFPREATTLAESSAEVPSAEQTSELERLMSTAPRTPLVIPTEGAKVLIVKFNDYQCPACAQSYLAYKPVLAKYEASNPGAVRVVLKDYPLEAECNSAMTTTLHAAACEAAVAVRLARPHNRAEAMEEWLYTHQQEMTPATVRQAARDVGQVTDFEAKYGATLELVKADIGLGRQLGIRSTPTFFLNGVKIEGAWAPQYIDQAIAYELQHPR